MASERDPIPCPVCREVIIGPLSAAVHLSDMHGLSMYGALARLTLELEEARERERGYREALERVADGGCERFAGTDCWQMGMNPNATDYADRVCDPCFARLAFVKDTEGGGAEPPAHPVRMAQPDEEMAL